MLENAPTLCTQNRRRVVRQPIQAIATIAWLHSHDLVRFVQLV